MHNHNICTNISYQAGNFCAAKALSTVAFSNALSSNCERGVFFKIYCCHNNLSYCQLGISVNKKISKIAPNRNYMKRCIREHIRLHHASYRDAINTKYAIDIVVIVIKFFDKTQYNIVVHELTTLITKVIAQIFPRNNLNQE